MGISAQAEPRLAAAPSSVQSVGRPAAASTPVRKSAPRPMQETQEVIYQGSWKGAMVPLILIVVLLALTAGYIALGK